jgi:hypothetical protein
MGSAELKSVLEFILNKASESEFEVVVKACERRRRDMTMFAGLGGINPSKMAEKMAGELEAGMGTDLGGIKDMARDYIAEIIRREAPDATEEQVKALLEMYLPSEGRKAAAPEGLPPDALLTMVKQFVAYSLGVMPPSEQQRLWESMPSWQESYWKAFPGEIKALVEALLNGKIDEDTFTKAVLSVAGK